MSACSESEPFALQVLGNDMAPEFPDGAVIIVEPSASVSDGDFVVAWHDGGVILRRLHIDAGTMQLLALDPRCPAIAIDSLERLRGRVVQRAGRRRSERRHYP